MDRMDRMDRMDWDGLDGLGWTGMDWDGLDGLGWITSIWTFQGKENNHLLEPGGLNAHFPCGSENAIPHFSGPGQAIEKSKI